MKLKTQVVLGILFLLSFIKSFMYSSNFYDVVFIIVLSILYISQQHFTEKSDKKDLEKLTADINTRLNQQDEALESIRSNTSKMALSVGMRR